jgi:acetyl/propionyl-CoA carboxylase alpha subunit
MISKLLVANRGEIARRIFRTCHEMGISTVAVYSEPDRSAPFVQEADEAMALGGASPADSYLRVDAILEAASRTGADAVHPGYGFLAENASFARAVIEAGLTWIGPSPEAIETMGSKLASKALMTDSGVPTLPSIDLTGVEDSGILAAAEEIGYPVLVKASAGGGGKGMRIVRDPDALVEAARGAEREALSAFGDGTVFLERYLDAPRHIEIQVFGDTHGNTVSLFERECSIQRRHQKIVEESPSPAIYDELRQRMGEAAVNAARAVDYVGAGTVEFLFQDGDFYFLEMNTRLQVEHPVTEEITGLDLVRLQILVAQGLHLPEEALSPSITGSAIEVRLYAEDARSGFLPVTGLLDTVEFPDLPGLRVDSGVESGDVVSPHYDPMLAKVIAWAPTRPEAAVLLARALRLASLHGSITNRDLLVRILEHPEFLAGDTDTHFLERHDPVELSRPLLSDEGIGAAALAAALADQMHRRATSAVQTSIPSGWRNVPSQLQKVAFSHDDRTVEIGYSVGAGGSVKAEIDGAGLGDVRIAEGSDEDRIGLEVDHHLRWYRIRRVGDRRDVATAAGGLELHLVPRFPSAGLEEEPGSLHAPMPGKVISVNVAVDEHVEEGQSLLVMEAMKMEHTLRAPFSGSITAVRCSPGDQVEADAVLVVVEES